MRGERSLAACRLASEPRARPKPPQRVTANSTSVPDSGRMCLVADVEVPSALRSLLTSEVARELASTYGDQVVFPDRVNVDRPDDAERLFPTWPTSVLVISVENQGVCAWGVPIGDREPPVLVGGDLFEGTHWSAGTTRYAPNVESFVASRRWDHACLNGGPLIQAQAAELDGESLDFLRGRFSECLPTKGWPGAAQHRFAGSGVRIMLWSAPGQCDWWISGTNTAALRAAVVEIMALSDLGSALWSNDDAGEELLRVIGAAS